MNTVAYCGWIRRIPGPDDRSGITCLFLEFDGERTDCASMAPEAAVWFSCRMSDVGVKQRALPTVGRGSRRLLSEAGC